MTGARGLVVAACASLVAACSPPARDVVPASRDVVVADAAAPSEAYEYVARRPHGVVALAEARHIDAGDARALVERLADALERCAEALEREGRLVEGAARVVAVAGPTGTPAVSVRVSPGEAVAQNALVCIVAPVRATTLPPATASASPGFAIEATWGPRSAPTPAPDAAGADGG